MAATKTKSKGKSGFIKEMLLDNPKANHKIVNEAWTNAGMTGTISDSLVNALRGQMGLTGNLRNGAGPSKKAASAAKTAKKTAGKTQAKANAPASVKSARSDVSRVIVEAEADIDRLIFKLMSAGGLTEIEDALRGVRRKLVLRGKA